MRLKNNEIREMIIIKMTFNRFVKFADLIKIKKIEIEHFEIESSENKCIQWSSIQSWWLFMYFSRFCFEWKC